MIQSNQRSWKLTPQLVVYVLKFFLVFLKYLLERLKIKIGMYILCTHFLWLVVLTSILRPFSRLFPSCKTGWNYFKTSFSQHSRGSTTAFGDALAPGPEDGVCTRVYLGRSCKSRHRAAARATGCEPCWLRISWDHSTREIRSRGTGRRST